MACGFFAYVVFDTWGDRNGWARALPATIVMACFPVFIWVFKLIYHQLETMDMPQLAGFKSKLGIGPISAKTSNAKLDAMERSKAQSKKLAADEGEQHSEVASTHHDTVSNV